MSKYDRCFRKVGRKSELEGETTRPCAGTRWGHEGNPDRYAEMGCEGFVEAE